MGYMAKWIVQMGLKLLEERGLSWMIWVGPSNHRSPSSNQKEGGKMWQKGRSERFEAMAEVGGTQHASAG